MTETITLVARYIGCGCFLRCEDNSTVFVNVKNRPAWLVEGLRYVLNECDGPRGGVVFTVREEYGHG